MKIHEYICDCGAHHWLFQDIGSTCSWCRGTWKHTERQFHGYYLGERSPENLEEGDDRISVIKIAGQRLIIMPPEGGLVARASCEGLGDIIPIDLWPGKIQKAHPNSLGKFI